MIRPIINLKQALRSTLGISLKLKFMKHILTFLIFLLPLTIFSQTVSVSEEISIRSDKAYDIIGKMKDRILVYHEKQTKIEIQAFNEKLHKTWKKELKTDHKKFQVIDIVRNNKEEFSLIYRYKKKGIVYIKLQKYDPGANLIDSTTIMSYPHVFTRPTPSVVHSENKSKIVLYSIEERTKFRAFSYDLNNMKILWEYAFKLEDFNYYQDHQEILVDNRGELYYIIGRDNKKLKREDHHYKVFRCSHLSDKPEFFTVPMEGHLSFDVRFEFDNLNKKLVAAGLYSDKNGLRSNGYFVLRVPSNNPANFLLQFTPFKSDFLSELEGKTIEKNKGLEDVEVREIVLRQDGGLLMVCERIKEYERRMSTASRGFVGNDGLRQIVDYYHDDLFVISIHPNGEEHWKTMLHKKQYSQDDNAIYSSYFLLKTPSSLRLLFNDDIRFENTVSEYVLQGNGEYDRNSVMSTEDQNIRLRFMDSVQTGSRELIIPSERRNNLRLVQVNF